MARGQVKPDAELRGKWFAMRLTAEEKEALDRAAETAGLAASELARRDWLTPVILRQETEANAVTEGV